MTSAFPRHRSFVAVSGAYVCAYGHKLSLTAALPLTPTPPAAPMVSARSRSAVNPQPPLAFPSRRRRAASFLPPLARSPYCQLRSSHPQRKKPPPLQALGTATSISRLRRYAHPKPRWAVRRCTDSAPATMATAALTSSSLRRTARRGRQTLKPQADFRDCLSLHKLCDTPLCCLLQALCARSCFASGKPITPSFTSVTRHIVITAHRHINPST